MPIYNDRPAIPVLETERLRLRGHRVEDFADCAAMWSDPIVTRFIGGRPSSTQQTWARLLGYLGHWCALDFGYWAIEEEIARPVRTARLPRREGSRSSSR